MSFDALTIGGMLAAILSGGFLVGVVRANTGSGGRLRRSDTACKDTRS